MNRQARVMFIVALFTAPACSLVCMRSPEEISGEFLVEASQSSLAEVRLGGLAEQRGRSPEVKDFGRTMVENHTRMLGELRALAQDKKVRLPDQPSAKHEKMLEMLQQSPDNEFDAAYIKVMEKEHATDISKYEKYMKNGQDRQVRDLVGKTLPTLREHRERASKLKEKMLQPAALLLPRWPAAAAENC